MNQQDETHEIAHELHDAVMGAPATKIGIEKEVADYPRKSPKQYSKRRSEKQIWSL